MYKSTLVLALVAAASAADSTVSLWLPGFDQQSIVASVVSSDATATAYALACGDPDSNNCGVPPSFTVTEGPSTLHYIMTADNTDATETIELACQVTGSSTANCQATINGLIADTTTISTTSATTLDASDLNLMAVTVTAGAVGSAANTAASTTGSSSSASSTGSSSASSTKGSSSSASTTKSGSSTGSAAAATGSSSSSVSTGGVAMITQAPWVMGAAAALAYAAL